MRDFFKRLKSVSVAGAPHVGTGALGAGAIAIAEATGEGPELGSPAHQGELTTGAE